MRQGDISDIRRFYYRYFLWVLLFAACGMLTICVYGQLQKAVPDSLNIRQGEEEKLKFFVPVSAAIYEDSVLASGLGGVQSEKTEMKKIEVDTTRAMVRKANEYNYYQMDLKLFGVIPLKTVDLNVLTERSIYPVGLPIGIYVKTNGVLVVDMSSFENRDGMNVEPAKHVLQKGDYILKVNEEPVGGKKELISKIRQSGGEDLIFTLLRNGAETKVRCTPELADDGEYKLGIWIRDSAQGIGTLTYLDENGRYGALGHGINDVDTNALMLLKYGGIYRADIVGIEKGKSGHPGVLTGVISFDEYQLGNVTENTQGGIFGQLSGSEKNSLGLTGMPIALKQEIRIGDAKILCKIGETSKLYDVEITKVHYSSEDDNRGIVLAITDQELLSLTGGIVQGMSGAPIIQDGKVVGAVTHVLINDPTRGYGIFIENML